ncbi:hypothetical protein CQW23_29644 [Capsicum baccatum]|uniref:Uncharacterized protein n=1 Tax=Capsicum baccatum TaxID=33114 RepID=A0A2G2VCL5_CAPBA|nr:hypothetical protein CQW23_29644 [Capsicum baccatum]
MGYMESIIDSEGIPQPECAARVGVSESDMPQGARPVVTPQKMGPRASHAHDLLQFKQMCTFNPNASDDCYIPTTLAWNNSTNFCSWNRVHCDEMTGQVIELDLRCSGLQGKFHSNSSLFQLSNLKRLDLSFNNFFGLLISAKFGELSSLMHLDLSCSEQWNPRVCYRWIFCWLRKYFDSDNKGTDLELPRVLTSYMFIDLSRNRFEGYLPTIIGDLVGLRVMNLSHNGLEGIIAESLHQLSVLESLDLSSNKIGSEIPQQLASLTFLAVLNLSHNHLVGCIPNGKQFDTFESSSYQGNDGLCGLPLSKDCGGNDGVPQASTPVELDDDEEEEEGGGDLISWQAVLMGFSCGLAIGLSIIYICCQLTIQSGF